MAPRVFHLFLAFLLWLSRAAAAGDIIPSSTVSEFLEQHGLPGGLLPALVTDYSLLDDGTFTVHLEQECYHKFNNLVWYDTKISGKLSYGRIDDLSGIEAKELFIWLSVTGIRVDQSNRDYIIFDVGIATKKLAASLFQEPPTCTKSMSGTFFPDLAAYY